MAAAIPATNKWLLTKQASVALSGLWDDRQGVVRRDEAWRWGRMHDTEAKLWTVAPQGDQDRDDPLVGSGGHIHEELSGDHKQGEDGKGKKVHRRCVWGCGCGWERGMVNNCMECAECSGPAVRSSFISGLYVRYNLPGCQASATISQPSLSLPPSHPHPTLTPHLPAFTLSITHQLSSSLWWLHRGIHLHVLWFFWLKLNNLQHALLSDLAISSFLKHFISRFPT